MTIKDRSNLISDINVRLPDNNVQAIAPADVRETLENTTDSAVLRNDENAVVFTPTAGVTHTEGLLYYDSVSKSFVGLNDNPNVSLNMGEEMWSKVINKTGVTIPNGTPVYYQNTVSGYSSVVPAIANDIDSRFVIGVTTEDIANDDTGYATKMGRVNDVDTSAWAEGTILWLSPTVPGGYTDEYPAPDYYRTLVGKVSVQDGTVGTITLAITMFNRNPADLSYFIPMAGVTDNAFPLLGQFLALGSSQTTNYTPPIGIGNQHLYILVNSIATGGDITITGTSLSESTAVPVVGDSEVISIDTTTGQYYQSSKKWWEVTNVAITGGGITGLNYDVGILGYFDSNNTKFAIAGYRADIRPSGNTPDVRFRIRKVANLGNNKVSFETLEDIGFDSTNTNGTIIDNLRTGANDRSYTMGVELADNNSEIVFKQGDFDTYFPGRENIVNGDNSEGIIIDFLGEPTGGLTNIDHITLTIQTLV